MCAIVGVFGYKEAVVLTYLGFYGLQHREKRAGIVSSGIFDNKVDKEEREDEKFPNIETGEGKVTEVFKKKIKQFTGTTALGFVGTKEFEIQPFKVERMNEVFTFCYDGEIANSADF